jgi:hypothetical protein
MAGNVSTAGVPPVRTVLRRHPILLAALAIVVVAAIVAIVVVKLQRSPGLDLTGKWVAHQGPTTVDLTLAGTSTDLTGRFVTRNAPFPISGPVSAHVKGTRADVTLNLLGSTHTGTCTVSNTKIVCVGSGSDTSTLTLTFTRS